MTPPRKTTLWAAMLSAWLAAGQTAPPAPAAEAPDSPRQADETAAPAPAPPPRG